MLRYFPLFILLLALLSGCQSTYYAVMEKAGIYKRDILVERVEDARTSQQEAQQQFKDALEQFRSVVVVEASELDAEYSQLQAEYDDSVAAADKVSERIKKVEQVAEDLFTEWEKELSQYTNARLRSQSANKLAYTKKRYSELLAAMHRAEKRMAPVLAALKDNVLYLKHNLNAQAIGSLRAEYHQIKGNINLLIQDMEAAIQRSELFIKQIEQK